MAGEKLLITGGPLTGIEIGAKGIRSIVQNVKTVLGTMKGTVFLDRDFGADGDVIDEPMTVAMQRTRAGIAQEVEREEPRVKVKEVNFVDPGVAESSDGTLVPQVLVEIREGVLL